MQEYLCDRFVVETVSLTYRRLEPQRDYLALCVNNESKTTLLEIHYRSRDSRREARNVTKASTETEVIEILRRSLIKYGDKINRMLTLSTNNL